MSTRGVKPARNKIAAPLLIFGVGTGRPLGVKGAALASLIALIIGTAWLALYFRGTEAYLHFRPREWKPQMREWAGMLKVGLPAGAEFALMSVFLFVVYTVSRPFGSAAQAGFGIGLRIVEACFLPVAGIAPAAELVARDRLTDSPSAVIDRECASHLFSWRLPSSSRLGPMPRRNGAAADPRRLRSS